jgi:hypothetical protein
LGVAFVAHWSRIDAMRALVAILIVVVTLSVVDMVVFKGRYTGDVWREAKFQGDRFNVEVRRLLGKARF